MLTRRKFSLFAILGAALPSGLLVTACGASQTTIALILTTIGTGLSGTLIAAGQPDAAAQVLKYAQAAADAVKNWVPGTPGQDVIQALNDFIANLNLLPIGDPTVLAVIQNAISTIEGLLADFGVTASQLAAAAQAHTTLPNGLPVKYPSNATLKAALGDWKTAHNAIVKVKYPKAVVK